MPEGWTRLGSLLTDIGQRVGLTEEEFARFAQRDSTGPNRSILSHPGNTHVFSDALRRAQELRATELPEAHVPETTRNLNN